MANAPVIAVELTDNSKLGKISITAASQSTCPPTCPLLGNGCYAENGYANFTTKRLNLSEIKMPLAIARLEASLIKKLSGKKMLRLHVVGDCYIEEGVKVLADAAKEYTAKFDKPVYTYTHGHETTREAWGEISVLRSCETMTQVEKAHNDGFASALVVDSHPENNKAFKRGEFTIVPCPQQIGTKNNCADCKLCTKDALLHKQKMVIAFAVHGSRIKKAKEILNNLQSPQELMAVA